jgi:hypothetical protein
MEIKIPYLTGDAIKDGETSRMTIEYSLCEVQSNGDITYNGYTLKNTKVIYKDISINTPRTYEDIKNEMIITSSDPSLFHEKFKEYYYAANYADNTGIYFFPKENIYIEVDHIQKSTDIIEWIKNIKQVYPMIKMHISYVDYKPTISNINDELIKINNWADEFNRNN